MNNKTKHLYKPVKKYKVTEEYNEVRLDNCLFSQLKYLPKSKVYSIIRKGEVRVNGSRCKPHRKLKLGDEVRIPPHIATETKPLLPSKTLIDILKTNIIYNDNSILVLDKPVGLASHGGSGIKLGLIEAVRQISSKFKNAQLVHRLDKDTSGCIVLALKRSMLRKLNEEMREGRVEKNYIAITNGEWPKNIKLVKTNLRKNRLRSGEREVQINSVGKESKTLFKLVQKTKKISLIECKLLTGRTHQIRVQTSSLGFPIIGDKKYGDSRINAIFKQKGVNRMLLHAKSINFPRFNLCCTTEEPEVFIKIMNSNNG